MRFVTEKYNSVVSATDLLVRSLSGEKAQDKKEKALAVNNSTGDLLSALAKNDQPVWLTGLNQHTRSYAEGRSTSYHLMQFILENRVNITTHSWVFDQKSEAFDFDSVFERYRSESRLPELFDEIVRILEEIQNSGEVDSVTMMSALGKVIATLKKSKDGSYFSVNSAWSFLVSFLQNYMWAELIKLPVLGTAMEALKQTIEQTNQEMFKVHTEVQNEMQRTVEEQVKGLNRSNFKFIGYDKNGHNLEISSEVKALSTTV
ncbi:hypothetical protein C9J47_05720 [Photobacterium indicum]|uniref:Uncharacterized protein n=1 Tax=Photobacterium indicum TaxID=81447 RepID=A0A2T3LFI1_9GAMM|nr:hypothetical protein C9J47_05720 [Photobacterium indicum]